MTAFVLKTIQITTPKYSCSVSNHTWSNYSSIITSCNITRDLNRTIFHSSSQFKYKLYQKQFTLYLFCTILII